MANTDEMLAVADAVRDKSVSDLISYLPEIYQTVRTDVEREQIHGIIIDRAMQIGKEAVKSVENVYKALISADKIDTERLQAMQARQRADENPVFLELDRNGRPLDTLNNFRAIMMFDTHYKDFHYNLLKAAPEIHYHDAVKGTFTIHAWEDADEAESMRYIEEKYKIYSDRKHKQALLLLFRDREYNPVRDIVDNLPAWDGQERIKNFLTKWMGCDDTPYVHEVSRLIFAGGINRLYNPGCKFDDVPVLIGTRQGEGKSTIIKWLAIHDDYYTECTQFDGSASIEQLEGAWICEISEMLALKRASEQEAVKAFITRQVDKYRKPYARNPTNLPRRCILIGSTNVQNFLSDRTGNRRWYPVKVNMSGYDLYDMEAECRDYILLCWAEARDKFKQGKMPNFADKSLVAEYRAAQADSMEDDWRDGAIMEYLQKKDVGDKVCVRQVAREALPLEGDTIKDPSRRDAHEIGLLIDKQPNWKRCERTVRIDDYGVQRGWVKIAPDNLADISENREVEIPF